MLERNVRQTLVLSISDVHVLHSFQPKKDKILSKHEFSGNKPAPPINDNEPGPSGGDGRGRVRGGRGRGGRGERGGGGGGVSARDRAWKDKNKARQANHNRKRGHDKKMARVAPPAG